MPGRGPETGERKWRFPGQGRARLLLGSRGQVQALLEPVLTGGTGHRLQMETKCNRNETAILKAKTEEDSTTKIFIQKFEYRYPLEKFSNLRFEKETAFM